MTGQICVPDTAVHRVQTTDICMQAAAGRYRYMKGMIRQVPGRRTDMMKKMIALAVTLIMAAGSIQVTAFGMESKGDISICSSPEAMAKAVNREPASAKSGSSKASVFSKGNVERRLIVSTDEVPGDDFGADNAWYYSVRNLLILEYSSRAAADKAEKTLAEKYGSSNVIHDSVVKMEDLETEDVTVSDETSEAAAETQAVKDTDTSAETEKEQADKAAQDSKDQVKAADDEDDSDDIPQPFDGIKMMGFDKLKQQAASWDGEVRVAVIDSGVDEDHPWFTGRLDRKNSVNLAGDGDTADFNDLSGHGSHVSGIITQATPSQVQIMAVRVFDRYELTSLLTITLGVDYAAEHGADVMNMSLGHSKPTKKEINMMDVSFAAAMKKGITVCAASGNEFTDVTKSYPASSGWTIAVGSLEPSADSKDGYVRSNFSNNGTMLDFSAPGRNIESAWCDGETAIASGTSMATPHFAAAAAMVRLKNPEYNQWDVYADLQDYARDFGETGKDVDFGYGCDDMSGYADGSSIQTDKPHQGLTADADITKTMNDKGRSFSMDAKLTRGDGRLSYSSTDSSVAEISGSNVIVRGTGRCEIVVTASETENYSETQRRIQLKIEKGTQKFVIPQTTYSRYTTDKPFYIRASVEAPADGRVTFTANDNDILTVEESGLVRLTGKTGSAKVFAEASGTGSFQHEISEGITVTVTKKPAASVTKPGRAGISSLRAGKKKFTVKWKKQKSVTGYQVRYSQYKNMKKSRTVTVRSSSATSKTVTKLKAKKNYYVQVRAYRKASGKIYYGTWSAAKKVKTKK